MTYNIQNNKVYNENNEVAVIVSAGYGAGWYSWNTQYKDCLFDPDCVMEILDNPSDITKLTHIANTKWPEGFWHPGRMEIVWVPVSKKFDIHEYDGYESLYTLEDVNYPTHKGWGFLLHSRS